MKYLIATAVAFVTVYLSAVFVSWDLWWVITAEPKERAIFIMCSLLGAGFIRINI